MKFYLYTSETCGFCHRAINLLEQRNLPFQTINVKDNVEDLQAKIAAAGFPPATKVPQIFVDDKYIGGHDNLVNWLRENNL